MKIILEIPKMPTPQSELDSWLKQCFDHIHQLALESQPPAGGWVKVGEMRIGCYWKAPGEPIYLTAGWANDLAAPSTPIVRFYESLSTEDRALLVCALTRFYEKRIR